MAHLAYSPVGYSYDAEDFCLDCIVTMFVGDYPADENGNDGCQCAECVLDKAAEARGIDRYDESSFDMSDFPKSIPYHNDLHADCELEESWEPHWSCNARCARCGDVIDGTERYLGNHEYITVCPGEDAYLDRLEQQMAEEEDDE